MSLSIEEIKKRFELSYDNFTQQRLTFYRWREWRRCKLPRKFQVLFSGHGRRHSALVPPFIRMVIRELRSKIYNQIFGARPHFTLKIPGTAGSLDSILERNRDLLLFQQGQEEESYREKVSFQILDWLTYGIGIKQPVWRRRRLDTEMFYEGPGWDSVPIFKFLPSKVIDSNGGISYYFIQHVVFYGQLLKMAADGVFPKEAVEAIELRKFDDCVKYLEGYDTGVNWGDLDITKLADKMVYPVAIWSYADGDELVTVANHKFELKRKPNIYGRLHNLGLSVLNVGREADAFVGESAIGIIEDNFLEKFGIRNQRSDARQVSINPQYLSDDPNCPPQFESAPGRIHRVSSGRLNSYKPLEWKDETDKTFVEEKYVTQEMKEALGLSNVFMGLAPERKETATTQMILQQNAATDLQFTTSLVEGRVVCGDVRAQMTLNNKLMPDVLPDAYAGVNFHPSELLSHAVVTALGLSQSISKTVMVANITGLMNQWLNVPQLERDVNWVELARRQVNAMELPDPDGILPDPKKKDIPIDKENWLMSQGVPVPVDDEEDHMYHRVKHMKFAKEAELGQNELNLLTMHIEEHEFKQQVMLGGSQQPGPDKRPPMHERDALQSVISKFRPGSRSQELIQ